ncbi:MAG TPA: multicopper oxidase domain-containing protein [Nitriliruptorales bacterium]
MTDTTDTTDELTVNWPALVAISASVLALFLAIFALGKALAVDASGPDVSVLSGDRGAAGTASVTLSEFAIGPDPVMIDGGGVLTVTNNGAAVHNLAVKEGGPSTPDLAPAESATLDISTLAPGTYTLVCTIPGHEAAGMSTTLTVGGEGSGAHAGMTGSTDPAALQAEMLERMVNSIGAFPAETEGQGAAVLEPTILEDGTKLFELTVDEVAWEVEPGKIVDAVGYNGIVPGPTMYVDTGDRVTIRVSNELDHGEGTSLHPHGLKDHEFAIDGVTFISQDPIASGDWMDYTFVATEESVVTYHSHHMSLHQVPNGLFGAMIIGDYAALAGVEGVVDEQVMILNDAGNIGFSLNGKSFPATTPYVYSSGDRVVVHYANEGQMAHPMHLHNQTGTVIAKDGYLLQPGARYQGDTFNIAPGERLTVVYELGQPGTWVWHCHILSHVKKTDGAMFGMLTAVIVEE